MSEPQAEDLRERIGREAYAYGYAQARRLRELGCEPKLTRGLPFLLWEHFEPKYDPGGDGFAEEYIGEFGIVAEEAYPEHFARGFLDEAVHLERVRLGSVSYAANQRPNGTLERYLLVHRPFLSCEVAHLYPSPLHLVAPVWSRRPENVPCCPPEIPFIQDPGCGFRRRPLLRC